MTESFDFKEAKNHLQERDEQKKQKRESHRQEMLPKVIRALKQEFEGSGTEVYLIGSIIEPFKFTSHSDVDIVLKNFQGDRFKIWTKLESAIENNVDIVLFEKCSFQDMVLKYGFKVV